MGFLSKIKRLQTEETGATVIEYAFIAGLVGLAAFGAISNLGDSDEAMFDHVSSNFTQSVDGSLQ
ncbi:MAG: Flp family type IVb pilin [Pseudomonadota bacterium]